MSVDNVVESCVECFKARKRTKETTQNKKNRPRQRSPVAILKDDAYDPQRSSLKIKIQSHGPQLDRAGVAAKQGCPLSWGPTGCPLVEPKQPASQRGIAVTLRRLAMWCALYTAQCIPYCSALWPASGYAGVVSATAALCKICGSNKCPDATATITGRNCLGILM